MKKATHQDTKKHNTHLALKTIYDQGQISRVDIARTTHLTRPTVSDIVSELMQAGLVEEIGMGPSIGGKPPILLSVADNSRYLIGIDLANSEFRGAVINLRGEVKHRVGLPIRDRDGDAALAVVYQLADELIAVAQEKPVLGIGIGTPGLLDGRRGVVRQAVNLDWQDLPLGDLLERRYGVPTYIANDCQVAALAEITFGSHKDISNLALLKVGRGVGAGIVLNRNLYYGDSYGAGEIGHVSMVEGGDLCSCGQRGCLETLASSRAVVKKVQAIAKSDPQCLPPYLASAPEAITSDTVLKAFAAGNEAILAVIGEAGLYLGKAVAHLVSALNIQHVVIAGSMSRYGEGLLEPVRQQVSRGVLPAIARETSIEKSDLGTDIVILGAAALLLSQELGII